jgi:hypothetical protein
VQIRRLSRRSKEGWVSGNLDALGDLATAALAARALEPEGGINHAEVANAQHRCANCEAPLAGNFCANCGQKAHVHRSLAHVGEELLHGITHFDGKAWTTLPLLLFRPGKLTRDYIEGKRTRYIAPVPLFLLAVFLMFFVFSFVHIGPNVGGAGATDDGGKPLTQAEAIKELPKVEAEIRDLDKQIAEARAKGDTAALPGLKGARIGVAAARDAVKARASGEVRNPIDLPGAIAEELGSAGKDGDINVDLGNETLNVKARKMLKNPELVLYKIQGKLYKFSFLLVPLSIPWLWLVFFWKRDVRLYDHAVFSLYSISFMSLLFVIGSIAIELHLQLDFFWFVLIFLAPITHMFLQLRGTYSLSKFGAAWRTVWLATSAVMTLAIYALLMVVIGVLD